MPRLQFVDELPTTPQSEFIEFLKQSLDELRSTRQWAEIIDPPPNTNGFQARKHLPQLEFKKVNARLFVRYNERV